MKFSTLLIAKRNQSFYKVFAGVLFLLFCISKNTLAQFTTPTIDASLDAGSVYPNSYTSGSTTWYMTWNNTDLFVFVQNANETEPVTIYLDVDPIAPVNGGTNANGTLVGLNYDGYTTRPNLPFRADVCIYAHNGYRELFRRDGNNGWTSLGGGSSGIRGDGTSDYTSGNSNGQYASNNNSNGSGSDDRREFRISWSRLLGTINGGARPSSFNWMGYIAYGNNGNGMYAQVPVENYNGGSVSSNSNGIVRYFTVSSTADGSSTNPFGRNSFTQPLTATNNSFGAISVYDFTMNSSGQQIARLNTGGDWNIGGTLVAGAGTVYFGSGGSGYGNTTVANINVVGGTLNMDQTNQFMTVTGDVNLSSGTLKLSGTNGGDLKLQGNWNNSGGTFTPNGRAVFFTGSNAQTLTGATTFDYLLMSKTGSNNLTLNNAITVNQTLTFGTGNIVTGTNSVIMGSSGSTASASNSSHINGNQQYPISTGITSKTFDIGDAATLAKVTTAFTGVTTGGSVTASTTGSEHTNIGTSTINASKSVNRSWMLSSGNGLAGGTYGATFNYAATDIDAGATTSNFIVGNYNGSWSYPTVGTKTSTSTQATGLSSFGSFAIGEITTYTLTATAGSNGSISPSGATTVNTGSSQLFTITPNANYHVADVLVDGPSVGAVTSYNFTNVSANHTIAASFAINTFTITASAGSNGSISPSGATSVNAGSSQSFTITPNTGYVIADVLVDGSSVGAVSSYNFTNVLATHTIAASFAVSISGADYRSISSGNFSNASTWQYYNGTSWVSATQAPTSANNVTIQNGHDIVLDASYTVGSGKTLTLNSISSLTVNPDISLTVTGTASLNDQPLIFKSTASGTAQFGTSTGTITGNTNVTVERYIPADATRAWRILSIPTSGSQTIANSWQQATYVTTGTAGNLANGFDAVTPYTSMQTYNDATNTWSDITSTNIAISNKKAYSIYIRGNRTSTPDNSTITPTTLSTTGALYTGNQTITIPSGAHFGLIGNPYASAIDFTAINFTGSNVNPTVFYVWDPSLVMDGSLGHYQTFSTTNSPSWSPVPGSSSNYSGSANTRIESGQAFFVQTTAASASVPFTENCKVSSSQMVFRPVGSDAPTGKIKTTLTRTTGTNAGLIDINVVVYKDSYSDAVDNNDALELNNGASLSILRDGKNLIIEGRQTISNTDTIFFNMKQISAGQYKLTFEPAYFTTATSASLIDNYFHTITPISLTTTTEIAVTVDNNTASSAANRFKIVLDNSTPVPVTFVSVKAVKENNGTEVSWKVAQEAGTKEYVIEHSKDGRTFSAIGSIIAINSGSSSNYSFTDDANTGVSYYRIESINQSGDINYSAIVTVGESNSIPSINAVYANTSISLRLNNQPTGNYGIKLLSSNGQELYKTIISHAAGTATYSLPLSNSLAKGINLLQVLTPSNKQYTQKIISNN
ncbi:beta strand repeat-containing protein [Ferruginibacter albus]|uniref:beta strand repeat-containing protein n=1 Tax=Ferruginibacter albus TaxID=2875540 RepID=UPI001CC5572F|nr:hypothetical protein [Ferruginibacter albus]UAY51600.1 hypothetical protein K9M53_13515 [Ferruginibacter albus]